MKALFETKTPKKKQGRKKRLLRILVRSSRIIFNLALFGLLAAMISATGLYLYVIRDYANRLDERYPTLSENSFVYAANGKKIGEFAANKDRITVGPEALGKYLPDAVIAVEDRRFREHAGVDFIGVARAAWADLRSRDVVEGGSTITEQLMKNLFIKEGDWGAVSFWRRFKQASLALDYEQHHSKREILTSYLNTVYFGDGAYGAEVASRKYFDKSAKDLSLGESATLAGFLHAPSTYLSGNRRDTRRATDRRDEVLDLMREQGMISNAQRLKAEARPVEFAPRHAFYEKSAYRPFLDKVRREAEEKFGDRAIERGGLRLYTTFKPGLQNEAIASSKKSLYARNDPSAAIVTIAPQTGAIRVLAGQDKEFNLSLDARRQPGSAFKPFVLAAALKQGISPETNYISRNLEVEVGGHKYPVSNYGGIERGQITVSKAMAESDNTVFVQLAADVGYQNVADTANSLGITTPIDPYPSTAIGGLGVGVSPLDMASAYATFAAGGVYREPYAIERASRASFGKREEIYNHRREGKRVMSTNEAAMLTKVLRGVVEEGTASRFRDLDSELGRPSAGKTGTTDGFADAWYVGYTPRLSTAVWVGYPESRRSMVGVHGLDEVNGETLPLDIFADYMSKATAGQPVLGFPEPDESEFKVTSKGYAVKPIAPAPESSDKPLLAATDNLNNLGKKIQGMVDRALANAFGGG